MVVALTHCFLLIKADSFLLQDWGTAYWLLKGKPLEHSWIKVQRYTCLLDPTYTTINSLLTGRLIPQASCSSSRGKLHSEELETPVWEVHLLEKLPLLSHQQEHYCNKHPPYQAAPGAPFAPLSTYECSLALTAVDLLVIWQHSSLLDRYSPLREEIITSFTHYSWIFQVIACKLHKSRHHLNWAHDVHLTLYHIFTITMKISLPQITAGLMQINIGLPLGI